MNNIKRRAVRETESLHAYVHTTVQTNTETKVVLQHFKVNIFFLVDVLLSTG